MVGVILSSAINDNNILLHKISFWTRGLKRLPYIVVLRLINAAAVEQAVDDPVCATAAVRGKRDDGDPDEVKNSPHGYLYYYYILYQEERSGIIIQTPRETRV